MIFLSDLQQSAQTTASFFSCYATSRKTVILNLAAALTVHSLVAMFFPYVNFLIHTFHGHIF